MLYVDEKKRHIFLIYKNVLIEDEVRIVIYVEHKRRQRINERRGKVLVRISNRSVEFNFLDVKVI